MQSISWVTSDLIWLWLVLAPENCGWSWSNGIAVLWLVLGIYFDLASLKAHIQFTILHLFAVIKAFVYLIPTIVVLFETYPRSWLFMGTLRGNPLCVNYLGICADLLIIWQHTPFRDTPLWLEKHQCKRRGSPTVKRVSLPIVIRPNLPVHICMITGTQTQIPETRPPKVDITTSPLWHKVYPSPTHSQDL